MTDRSGRRSADGDTVVVGLLADPGRPTTIAHKLASELPDLLPKRVSEQGSWSVRAVTERLGRDESDDDEPVEVGQQGWAGQGSAGEGSRGEEAVAGQDSRGEEAVAVGTDRMRSEDWDLAVWVTDLPRHSGARPVVAAASADQGVALVSVPALGVWRVYPQVRNLVLTLVAELVGATQKEGTSDGHPRRTLRARLRALMFPIWRVSRDDGMEVRFLASRLRGRLRLLAGIVRANRPWRLAVGLPSALAATLGTSAYVLVSPSTWELSNALGSPRLSVVMLFAVTSMVIWMIVDHELWERRSGAEEARAGLYNTATAVSLTLGVAAMYATLFVLNIVVEGFIIDGELLGRTLQHPVSWGDYAVVAWFATSMATVLGALGSGFERDEVVHEAAYGYRHKQRHQDDVNREERFPDSGST